MKATQSTLALSVALLFLLAVTMVQVRARNPCRGSEARPHSGGLCGDRLVSARNNLCFLLSDKFPSYFNKRSARSINRIFDLTLEDLANMAFTDDDMSKPSPLDSTFEGPWPKNTKAVANQTPSHVQKRGMACDCCFNKCRPSILAQYC